MDGTEVPHYFLCPISLQLMKDPVTAPTGITYDRRSIERWLSSNRTTTCPVTNGQIKSPSDLTPNHTLHRLIQTWFATQTLNPAPIISHQHQISLSDLKKLINNLHIPDLVHETLRALYEFASTGEANRRLLEESGVVEAILDAGVVEDAVDVLHVVWTSPGSPVVHDSAPVESLTRALRASARADRALRATSVLRIALESASARVVEQLKPELFAQAVRVIRERPFSARATKDALRVLMVACAGGSANRLKAVEAGAVEALIEVEFENGGEKRVTELTMGVLSRLCGCAEGRERVAGHGAGIATVAKRILRVSAGVDELGVGILCALCRFSGSEMVVGEMVRVGGVAKLCMVLQAECERRVKEKARWALKWNSNAWKNSPCIAVYLLSRYP
ncbi:E3 ubiquitin-protein ligase PUB23 [Acorus calamus]|uniref:U-box domain-containing protein n=1 Tax=Acorus calamus TaxID=4465 RepID=A0AAV9DFA7_ACOCL|nr:E3 ubiquitin-protein ligase PUB23 [Acorus calamus]